MVCVRFCMVSVCCCLYVVQIVVYDCVWLSMNLYVFYCVCMIVYGTWMIMYGFCMMCYGSYIVCVYDCMLSCMVLCLILHNVYAYLYVPLRVALVFAPVCMWLSPCFEFQLKIEIECFQLVYREL